MGEAAKCTGLLLKTLQNGYRGLQWAPFAVCSMLTIGAALLSPAYGVFFAVGTLSVDFSKKVLIERKEGAETPQVCRLLASMRKDILGRVAIDALA